jgi:hypothetical protein
MSICTVLRLVAISSVNAVAILPVHQSVYFLGDVKRKRRSAYTETAHAHAETRLKAVKQRALSYHLFAMQACNFLYKPGCCLGPARTRVSEGRTAMNRGWGLEVCPLYKPLR